MFCQLKSLEKRLKDVRYSKHLDSSKIYFKKALPLALKKRDSIAVFYLYKYMGDAFEHHQKLDSTLQMYQKCAEFTPVKNLNLKAFLLNDMAYTYQLLRDYDTSSELTLKALKYAEKSGDKVRIAGIYLTLGENFSNLNLDSEASYYFKNGITLAKASKRADILEYAYRSYGNYLLTIKNTKLAYKNLTIASNMAINLKDSISMAYVWSSLADCHWIKKQKDSCFFYAKKAEGIWERRAEYLDFSAICMKQGTYYLAMKKFALAELYFKKAEQHIVEDLYFNEKLFSNFANLYQQTGSMQLAFDYLQAAKNTIEQIKDAEKKSKVASLNLKFNAAKKEILIKKEQQKNEISALKVKEKTAQITLILFLLAFLLCALAVIFFANKKFKEQNNSLNIVNTQLELVLNQKQILLKEINHRVKNNLTTLTSLLFLQARATKNEEVRLILNECQYRIQSMALIHQNLINEIESDKVDFYQFIEQLFESLNSSLKNNSKNIKVSIKKSNVILDVATANYLGLVLNEMVTNSYKYAFENQRDGEISLKMEEIENLFIVTYSDNGSGLPNGFDDYTTGFGFKIIRILSKQMKAQIAYTYNNNLSTFVIKLKNVS